MTGAQSSDLGGASAMMSLEDELSAALGAAADQIAHTECFDTEERAEVYSILDALKLDTKAHRALVKLLTERLKGETGHV